MVDVAKDVGQRQHAGFRRDSGDRRQRDADHVDGAELYLLQHLIFVAQHAACVDFHLQPPVSGLFQLIAHMLQRHDGGVASGLDLRHF